MKYIFLNQVMPGILGAVGIGLTGVLVAVIKNVGAVAIEYIATKKETVEQTLKLDKHKEEFQIAKEVWDIVEENYRITDKVTNLATHKADEFDKLLLKKIPYLSQEQLNQIRQAVAGEVNRGKTLLNEDTLKQQVGELIDKNNILQQENIELKNKFNSISSFIPAQEQ